MYSFTKDLETGITSLDSQNREFITAINRLLGACLQQGRDHAQVTVAANLLLNYIKRQFAAEDALQAKSKYPDYVNHKLLHDGFLRLVTDLVKELETEGTDTAAVSKINIVIVPWMINHIKHEDFRVAAHIRRMY